ncbi:MAG: LptF/LptG family permease [Phycisphaerae bacterium]|nr:LptF/LptG family permease [Phycisphaerae bacterium]MCZ2400234.1 LptF/LptG family permease [Phycisphaerae bacterium]
MSILDRYIAKTFLTSYLLLLAVLIGLVVLLHLLVNIDELTQDSALSAGQVVGLIADYYAHNLPLYYSQLGGPLLAISAAFTLAVMLRNNEMTALVASGLPLQRLLAPLLVCAIALLALWIANRELLIPAWAHQIARTHGQMMGRETGGVYCVRDERNALLTALRLFPRDGRLEGVYIVEPPETGRPAVAGELPSRLIVADHAVYDPQRRVWRLARGRRLAAAVAPAGPAELGDPIRQEPVDEYPFGLTPAELALRQRSEWADLLSLRQMNDLLASGLPNRLAIEVSRHVRLTYPLNQLTLLLLVVAFFLSREPRNVLVAGGQALLLGGLFFVLTFAVGGLVSDERWAALAAWAPILLFAPVAVLNLANVRT